MITYLDLTNAVLRRMREDEVTSMTETAYSTLVRDFVKEAVQEVEGKRNWNALRQSVLVPTVAGTYQYSVTGTGEGFAIAYVHEDTTDTDLIKAPSGQWMTHKLLSDTTQAQPQYYDVNGVDTSGDPLIDLYPIPDGVYNIYFTMKVKTTESPSDTTKVYLPERPIVLRAYQFALEERGDSQGDTLQLLEARYKDALNEAMQYDILLNEEETTWFED